MSRYLVALTSAGTAAWFDVEASSDVAAAAEVHQRILDGEPLATGIKITAIPMPTSPISVTRLADMSTYPAPFVQD